MIAHAKPQPDELDTEPTYNQLVLTRGDFQDATDALRVSRWSFSSRDPRIRFVEKVRAMIRDLAEQADEVLKELVAPPAAIAVDGFHWNDRPEDCPCPSCRNQVDQWARDHQGAVTLTDVALDHPKANPHLSVRELVRIRQEL